MCLPLNSMQHLLHGSDEEQEEKMSETRTFRGISFFLVPGSERTEHWRFDLPDGRALLIYLPHEVSRGDWTYWHALIDDNDEDNECTAEKDEVLDWVELQLRRAGVAGVTST